MSTTLIIADASCKRHLTGLGHPESPARFDAICSKLAKENLLRADNWQLPRPATEEEILLCHTPDYFNLVQREVAEVRGIGMLSTGDTPICRDSLLAAQLSVGAILTAIDAVLTGKAANAFVVARPPGHHACSAQGMGFCLFNSVAIGAAYAQRTYGIGPVLIVDWDLHHGNGTQEIFDADPTVFYFSTHQAGIYPGTGRTSDKGVGAALGTKMNVPIQPTKIAREEILQAVQGPLTKAMESFKPELVLISCGFDAHESDPLGQLNLTDADFGTLTRLVMQIADKYAKGRLVSVLEGGYNLEALGSASMAHVKELCSSV